MWEVLETGVWDRCLGQVLGTGTRGQVLGEKGFGQSAVGCYEASYITKKS